VGSIPNWTYLPEYAELGPEIIEAVRQVFESGRLILGPKLIEFEQQFAGWLGAEHGVGVNSGTDALFLALKALEVGPGDEVITVANTAVPTVASIRATGGTPVFVDIDPDTYLMDVSQVETRLTERTRAIMPVHLYGQPVDLDPLLRLAQASRLRIVEDCAQCHGARDRGRMTGTVGDIGAFSFYPTKVLGAYGDAGMCVTNSAELSERLRMLRYYGMQQTYYSEMEGYNTRLDEVQAAVLSIKLKTLDQAIATRRHIADIYAAELRDVPLKLPVVRDDATHAFFLYVVRTPRRDECIAALAREGIEARIHFPTPVHLMRGYEFLGYREGDLPHSEAAAREIMSLPMYPGLTDEEVRRVAAVLREALA
jgi:dTDP-3-amino-2,3,6-trideoxy-4-keto-D-glucose/dTDP-3-amino-3,4,6-trideoxy-alpha-D-glucose/dTDP-2,6-dideoxy-D-kanosamine transaminase